MNITLLMEYELFEERKKIRNMHNTLLDILGLIPAEELNTSRRIKAAIEDSFQSLLEIAQTYNEKKEYFLGKEASKNDQPTS